MEWHPLWTPDGSTKIPPQKQYVLLYIPNNHWDPTWPYYFGYWTDSGKNTMVWTVYPQRLMDNQGHLVTHWAEFSSPNGQHISQ